MYNEERKVKITDHTKNDLFMILKKKKRYKE